MSDRLMQFDDDEMSLIYRGLKCLLTDYSELLEMWVEDDSIDPADIQDDRESLERVGQLMNRIERNG